MSTITTTYQGRGLALIAGSQEQRRLWQEYPVTLFEVEKRVLDIDKVIAVMRAENCLPSQIAKIPEEQIAAPVIRLLDRIYRSAMDDYKTQLDRAEKEDQKSIATNREVRIYENYYGLSIVWRAFGSKFISQAEYNSDVRAHRFGWMIEVSVLEKQRYNTVKNHISNALPPLVQKLQDLERRNQTDLGAVTQVHQLMAVYKAHFPKETCIQGLGLQGISLPRHMISNEESKKHN